MKVLISVLIAASLLIFLGGAFEGLVETVSHHYGKFNARFPEANKYWWNPSDSWPNKFKNGIESEGPKFIGSTTVFVFVTDAYHLFRELERFGTRIGFGALAAGLLFLRSFKVMSVRRLFLIICAGMAAGWLIWSAGFHAVYTIYF